MNTRWKISILGMCLAVLGGCAANRSAQPDQINQTSAPPSAPLAGLQNAEARLNNHETRLGYLESLHVEAGVKPEVTPVYFNFGSERVFHQEQAKIEKVVEFLRQYPVFALKLVGYADTVGGKAYNLRLAERRNQAVLSALRQAGLPPETVVMQAIGEADGTDETRNPQNRRVEIQPYVHGRYR